MILHSNDLEVVLVKKPDRILTEVAAKFCTSPDSIQEILDSDYDEELVKRVLSYGHTAVSEFDEFVFAVNNVSRSLTHQLVRKRIGVSYAQESQRYVSQEDLDVIEPYSIMSSPMSNEYKEMVEKLGEFYDKLIKAGIPKEDARYILPQGCRTKILIAMNARSLNEFFAERCCARAQWEIRSLANKMLTIVKDVVPELFVNAGPKCQRLGYCPERKSCGRMPNKNGR